MCDFSHLHPLRVLSVSSTLFSPRWKPTRRRLHAFSAQARPQAKVGPNSHAREVPECRHRNAVMRLPLLRRGNLGATDAEALQRMSETRIQPGGLSIFFFRLVQLVLIP